MRTWVTFMDSMTVGIGESRINRSCPAPNTKTAASRISLRVENSLAIQTVTGTDTTIAEAYNSTRSTPAAKSLGKVIICHESTRHRRSVQDLSVFRDFNHGVRRAAPTLNVSYHVPQPLDRVIIPCATARSRGRTRDHCQPAVTEVLRTPNNDMSAVINELFFNRPIPHQEFGLSGLVLNTKPKSGLFFCGIGPEHHRLEPRGTASALARGQSVGACYSGANMDRGWWVEHNGLGV